MGNRLGPLVLLLSLFATSASASFHLMQIEQVIGGVDGDASAQAIQLRLRAGGQNQLQNSRIVAWDAAGENPVVLSEPDGSVASSAAGSRVLVATQSFESAKGATSINADFPMTAGLPEAYLAAGRITFENRAGTSVLWSLCWGGDGYTGDTLGSTGNDDDGDYGPCFDGPLPSTGTAALRFGGAAGDRGTSNEADYALTPGPATFTNNGGETLTLAGPSFSGQTPGGAFYRIEVPAGWVPADGLVIWNHGFSLSAPGPSPDLGPLAPLQLDEGYAVAASSYRLNGWAVFDTAEDIRELITVFETEFGVPEQTLIYGASLGGLVTAQLLEEPGLDFAGALPICGALAGSRLWDGALDLRLLYDTVCGEVAGAAIPGGTTGLPAEPIPGFNEVALGAAVNACTGILLPQENRTLDQQERLDLILAETTLPESFLLTVMGFATFSLADLIFDPAKLDGGMAMHNFEVRYDDIDIDMDIERVQSDPDDRRQLEENTTPTGVIGDTKIISIHTDKDGLVIVENESWYRERVPADQFALGIVVEDTPSHCDFSEGELVAAWESLRGWVAGTPQPDAFDLQQVCEGLVAGSLASGPCRFDPLFEVGSLDDRLSPRAGTLRDGFEDRGFERDVP